MISYLSNFCDGKGSTYGKITMGNESQSTCKKVVVANFKAITLCLLEGLMKYMKLNHC